MAHAGYARGSRRYGCPGSSATTSARTSGASPASRVRVLEHEYAAGREEPAVGRNLLGHPAQRRELEPRVHQVEPRLGQGAGEQVVGDQLDVRQASRAHHRLRLVQHLLRIVGPTSTGPEVLSQSTDATAGSHEESGRTSKGSCCEEADHRSHHHCRRDPGAPPTRPGGGRPSLCQRPRALRDVLQLHPRRRCRRLPGLGDNAGSCGDFVLLVDFDVQRSVARWPDREVRHVHYIGHFYSSADTSRSIVRGGDFNLTVSLDSIGAPYAVTRSGLFEYVEIDNRRLVTHVGHDELDFATGPISATPKAGDAVRQAVCEALD